MPFDSCAVAKVLQELADAAPALGPQEARGAGTHPTSQVLRRYLLCQHLRVAKEVETYPSRTLAPRRGRPRS
jgi:hypothetical protein